jgi:hypothetical protein
MKLLKNDCLQRLELYLTTPKGVKRIWLSPRETLVVPESYFSNQLQNLRERRLITVRGA